jgi:integrase
MQVRGTESTVFVLPSDAHKSGHASGHDRLVVLNRTAQSIVESVRTHPDYVFTYRGKPILRMTNTGWTEAREKVGMDIRVHDLRHTFGRRLRAAGVRHEDIKDLLGHKGKSITAHYSQAEIWNLIEAANSLCERGDTKPELTLVKRSA